MLTKRQPTHYYFKPQGATLDSAEGATTNLIR